MAGCGAAVALVPGIPAWLETTAKVVAAIGFAATGVFARDNGTTDEDAGAKPRNPKNNGTP
jgi:hypothetical protein